MQRLLFVCTENKLRSPTAEVLFSSYDGIEAIGAGTNSDAATPVSGDLIEWADIILVMEKSIIEMIVYQLLYIPPYKPENILKGKKQQEIRI